MKCNATGCKGKPIGVIQQKRLGRGFEPVPRHFCSKHTPEWAKALLNLGGGTTLYYKVSKV
jgi:hypothetical protein